MSWRATLALTAALAAWATPTGAQAQVSTEQAETLGRQAYRYGLFAGGFRLSMRLYWPKPSVLRGVWEPPPLERLP